MNLKMSDISEEVAVSEKILRDVFTALAEGNIERAISYFQSTFIFNDYGIDLHFNDKKHLAEFFVKEKELYPDSARLPDTVLCAGSHAVSQWTLHKTVMEEGFGTVRFRRPVHVEGSSVIRIDNEKIVEWSDYYDGLTSRRSALAAFFTPWVEL